MRTTSINTLTELARVDDRIFLLAPDLGFSVLENFANEFPDRFLNIGIAEQNAVGVASGLALSGKIVYVYSIVNFVTMRCYEQIRLDVAYMNTKVRLIGVGAGYSYGAAGTTHHSIEDIAIMRAMPNMTVCCPADKAETASLMKQSLDYEGPMYFRLTKNNPVIINHNSNIIIGKSSKISEGSYLAIISTGNMLEFAYSLAKELELLGKTTTIISMHTIKPFDTAAILEIIDKGIPIITFEEHNIIGGLGSAVSEIIAENGKAVKFKRFGVKDAFSHNVGSADFIRKQMGLGDLLPQILNFMEDYSLVK